MNAVKSLISDLREKRLLPVAVALIVALIAVPVFLSSSPGPVAAGPAPTAGGPSASVAALPAVSVTTTPSNGRLTGRSRDPFTQHGHGGSSGSTGKPGGTGSTTTTTTGSPGSSGATTGSKGSTTSGAPTGSATTPVTTTPTSTTPTATPHPAPALLTATESYHVTFALTTAAGGLNTIDPLERLSILPSRQQPLLVELGVLKGGNRVLFVVQPGAVVGGGGTCIPGPIDCEILSLAPNQIESLAMYSTAGVIPVAQFAVTEIKADQHPSAAAADRARREESAAGRKLLSSSKLTALSLFEYRPSLGAVVDLRNLSAGGS